MILYTPLPLELVMEGSDLPSAPLREASFDGHSIVVEVLEDGQYRLVKLLSTDPQDYLKPSLQPGRILRSVTIS